MVVGVSGAFASNFYFASAYYDRFAVGAAPVPQFSSSTSSLVGVARGVLGLRGSFEDLREAATVGRRISTSGLFVTSTASVSPLGLDSSAATATTLTSSEEVNTATTSYDTHVPTFSGSSTSAAEVEGVYNGVAGDDTLTFTATTGGVVGLGPITFDVEDSQSNGLGSVSFGLGYTAGTAEATFLGFTLALSSGSVSLGDSFEVTVSASVGTSVDPTQSFDGTGDSQPELDAGESVSAGSFTINGTSIAVAADDTLDAVLASITASAAGVTATYDPGTDSVILTQDTAGSAETITLGSDDTGFFSATKLDTAVAVPGEDASDDTGSALSSVGAFSSVATGYFHVNGTAIAVDVSVDSLSDLVDRINASGAGVTAGYDAGTDTVSLESDDGTKGLDLKDGTSGLFSALGISEIDREATRGARVFRSASGARAALGTLARDLRRFFSQELDLVADVQVDLALGRIRSALEDVYADYVDDPESDTLRSGLGIDFLFDDPADGILQLDESRLERAFREEADELERFLFETEEEGTRTGLVPALEGALDSIATSVAARLGADSGIALDLLA